MNFPRFFTCAVLIAGIFLLPACGGGSSPGDVRPFVEDSAPGDISGPKSFLLFPNPQVQADGSLQTNTTAYAEAYYAAIDPTNAKDTLAKWKASNGFDTGAGTQVTVVFGDQRDLGYGRRMTARQNADGSLAFVVENYLVRTGADYAYSSLNLDAAIVRDTKRLIGINAIEFSPGPAGGESFPKFFNFSATTGQRGMAVDLDGRGDKAMPGPCITCHGGRGDALTPPDATGKPRFNLVQNSASQARGDVQAHMHPFEVDTFTFSSTPGFTRAEQEAALKTMNKWILCTYPLPAGAQAFPEDACRRTANQSEWQSAAADLVKSAYGGNGMPSASFSDTYIPQSWVTAGQSTLYQTVVAPACRTCHIMRGSAGNSDIDFTSFAKFQGYAERIKAHVIDRGNMPLSKLVFDNYWSTTGPDNLATFLQAQGFSVRDATGVLLRPGRPIADPGPDRTVPQGPTTLSAANSLYASSYAWNIVSGPNGATPPANATLSNPDSIAPVFNASANGAYVLQLVASHGTTKSTPAQLTIVANNALSPSPSAIRFSNIKTVLQGTCVSCHVPGRLPRPPVFYTNEDRNGDGIVGDGTDDVWFYTEIRGLINFTEIVASPLLLKPSGKHHSGLQQIGFNSSLPPGAAGRQNYDLFLNWILNNAPQ